MELTCTKREVSGKKVRFLRRQGITPVHVFGHGIESLTLQCDNAELRKVMTEAGMTGLISLKIAKDRKPRSIMIREVQKNPLTGELLHVDFYQVNMEEKVSVEIPIVLVGDAPALKAADNYLTHDLNTLTVECLPGNIPSKVEIDLSNLAEAEQSIHVKDLSVGEGVTIMNNPEQLVVKISVRRAERAPVVAAPVEGEAAAEGAEGAAPAEGAEAKKAEVPAEEKK